MFRARTVDPIVFLSLAAGLLLATPAPATAAASPAQPGTYIVDPAGGGDFTDLQTALDAVPADSTVVVKGEWQDYRTWVRKPVTIFGLHLSTSYGYYEDDLDDAILEVDAGTGARVTLYGLEITLAPAWDSNATRGINVRSAGDVVISDATITCSTDLATENEIYDRDGDGVVVASANSLFIIRSTILGGGPGWLVWDCYGSNEHGTRGGNAVEIDSMSGPLVVEDSVLKGGDGGMLVRDCDDCSDLQRAPGTPGSGIVNRLGPSFLSNSTVVCGAPGHCWWSDCEPSPGEEGGPGIDVDGERIDLPDALHGNDAVLGQPLHVNGTGYQPDEIVLLFFSTSIGPALPLRQGIWLLDWPIVLVAVIASDDAGAFRIDGTVPSDPSIEGKSLALQAFAASQVSEPVVLVPWAPH